MKKISECKICGEKIITECKNIFQELMLDEFDNIKFHFHLKKHGRKGLKLRTKIKYFIKFNLVLLLVLCCVPIYFITFPFWWIHEKITNWR